MGKLKKILFPKGATPLIQDVTSDGVKTFEDEMIWQSMDVKFFAMLLKSNNLILQRFSDKPSTDEYTLHKTVFDKIDYSCFLQTEIECQRNKLYEKFKDYRQFYYFSCFCNLDVPISDMNIKFGNNHGVSLAFRKKTILERCSEKLNEMSDNDNIYFGEVSYDKSDLEKLEPRESDTLELFALLSFIKSEHDKNQNEFRIVYDMRESCFNGLNTEPDYTLSVPLQTLKIQLNDIVKIAIQRDNYMETILQSLLNYSSLSFYKEKKQNGYLEPLLVYINEEELKK